MFLANWRQKKNRTNPVAYITLCVFNCFIHLHLTLHFSGNHLSLNTFRIGYGNNEGNNQLPGVILNDSNCDFARRDR